MIFRIMHRATLQLAMYGGRRHQALQDAIQKRGSRGIICSWVEILSAISQGWQKCILSGHLGRKGYQIPDLEFNVEPTEVRGSNNAKISDNIMQ